MENRVGEVPGENEISLSGLPRDRYEAIRTRILVSAVCFDF